MMPAREEALAVLEIAVTVVVGLTLFSLVLGAVILVRNPDSRRGYVKTVRSIRWWMLPTAVCHVCVLVTMLGLILNTVPPLRFGWWMLLGGSGNLLLGQTGREGTGWHVLALAMPVALFALIPHLAFQEELTFRHGSEEESPRTRFRRQTLFGLAHPAFAGIPIGAGFVLIGSGLVFDCIYRSAYRRLLARTELVPVSAELYQLDYPTRPAGRYDPAAWDLHMTEFERVITENKRLRDEWFEERTVQDQQREAQIDAIRDDACAVAAAFHCCSNWIVVGVLLWWLFFQ